MCNTLEETCHPNFFPSLCFSAHVWLLFIFLGESCTLGGSWMCSMQNVQVGFAWTKPTKFQASPVMPLCWNVKLRQIVFCRKLPLHHIFRVGKYWLISSDLRFSWSVRLAPKQPISCVTLTKALSFFDNSFSYLHNVLCFLLQPGYSIRNSHHFRLSLTFLESCQTDLSFWGVVPATVQFQELFSCYTQS